MALLQQRFSFPWESGEEPGGKLCRRPAELFAGQSSSETRHLSQLGRSVMLNTIGDDFPSIITNQKDAVGPGLHLWWVFSLSGVAFTDLCHQIDFPFVFAHS
jgi:hypothetical protein